MCLLLLSEATIYIPLTLEKLFSHAVTRKSMASGLLGIDWLDIP